MTGPTQIMTVAAAVLLALVDGSPSRDRPARQGTGRASDRVTVGPSAAHQFYFSRAAYTGLGRGRFESWTTDYPKADIQFLFGLTRLTGIDAYERQHPVRLDRPELRRFPFLYAVEVGYMALTEAEVQGLRGYLLAGGFLVCDDFWGTREWENFAAQMARVLPEYPIVEIPLDHPLLHTFYEIDEILQVPNAMLARLGGQTFEKDGFVPHLRGIFDHQGRLMVAVNWNTDLGDAWEWADDPAYPIRFGNFAYQLGINLVVYGMSR